MVGAWKPSSCRALALVGFGWGTGAWRDLQGLGGTMGVCEAGLGPGLANLAEGRQRGAAWRRRARGRGTDPPLPLPGLGFGSLPPARRGRERQGRVINHIKP